MSETSKTAAMQELFTILDIENLDTDLFRGISPQVGRSRVFGGQVLAQSIIAAQRTVDEGRFIHSLHGYFMRPGDPLAPIIYEISRLRDGGSFSTRHVIAKQNGKAIFTLTASFQIDEAGLDHQILMPEDLPQPEELPSEEAIREKYAHLLPENMRKYWGAARPFELRPTLLNHYFSDEKLPAQQYVWVKANAVVPDDRVVQAALLAYLSDMTLLDTSLFAHGRCIFNPDLQVASLDHSMWFHRPCDLSDWLLYVQDSPSSSGARGFSRGSLYTRNGILVASTAQEGLIRVHNPSEKR